MPLVWLFTRKLEIDYLLTYVAASLIELYSYMRENNNSD